MRTHSDPWNPQPELPRISWKLRLFLFVLLSLPLVAQRVTFNPITGLPDLVGTGGAAGAGDIEGVTAGCGISGGGTSGTVTVSAARAVNAQTGTTYIYLDSDCGKLVTHTNGSAIAGTLPNAAGAGFDAAWFMDVQNRGAGTLTITPTTSTIDGAASLALTTNQGVRIVSDGTNYFTMRGAGTGGAPADAQYLALATNATLTVERVFTCGTGIACTDGGAGSTFTAAVDSAVAQLKNYCVDAVGTDTYACNLGVSLGSYADGQLVWVEVGTANTGAASLNLNSVGAKAIVKDADNATLANNDLRAGVTYPFLYCEACQAAAGAWRLAGTLGNAAASDLDAATGTVATAQIEDGAVTTAKLATAHKTRQFSFLLGADNGSVLVDGDDQPDIFINHIGSGITVTGIFCRSDGGTPRIQVARNDGTPANILTDNAGAGMDCATTEATGTIDTGEDNVADTQGLNFTMVTAGGVAKRVAVTIKYTVD